MVLKKCLNHLVHISNLLRISAWTNHTDFRNFHPNLLCRWQVLGLTGDMGWHIATNKEWSINNSNGTESQQNPPKADKLLLYELLDT